MKIGAFIICALIAHDVLLIVAVLVGARIAKGRIK